MLSFITPHPRWKRIITGSVGKSKENIGLFISVDGRLGECLSQLCYECYIGLNCYGERPCTMKEVGNMYFEYVSWGRQQIAQNNRTKLIGPPLLSLCDVVIIDIFWDLAPLPLSLIWQQPLTISPDAFKSSYHLSLSGQVYALLSFQVGMRRPKQTSQQIIFGNSFKRNECLPD